MMKKNSTDNLIQALIFDSSEVFQLNAVTNSEIIHIERIFESCSELTNYKFTILDWQPTKNTATLLIDAEASVIFLSVTKNINKGENTIVYNLREKILYALSQNIGVKIQSYGQNQD